MGMAALVVLMLAAGQAGSGAAMADAAPDKVRPTESTVSVERVREGLQRPALKIPAIDPIPVFRASVEEILLETPLQVVRRELAADSGYTGGTGRDVLPLIMGVVKSIRGAYRAYSEARIRKEVQAALTAFCAEHDCSVLEAGPPPIEGVVLPRRARP
jgi:hypothetical protein